MLILQLVQQAEIAQFWLHGKIHDNKRQSATEEGCTEAAPIMCMPKYEPVPLLIGFQQSPKPNNAANNLYCSWNK